MHMIIRRNDHFGDFCSNVERQIIAASQVNPWALAIEFYPLVMCGQPSGYFLYAF